MARPRPVLARSEADTAKRPRREQSVRGILMLAVVLLLSACGARVDSVLTVAADGSGTRVITVTLASDDLEEYVEGGADALQASIERHAPDELAFSELTEVEEGVEAEFTLAFDDVEDYQSKIQSLLTTSGYTSELNDPLLIVQDTDFVSGIQVEENFTSRDLMGWLTAGLIADGVLGSDQQSDAMESGSTQIAYGEAVVDTSNAISFDKVVDNGITALAIETTQQADGSWTRLLRYTLPIAAYNAQPEVLDGFLQSATPEGGTVEQLPSTDAGTVTFALEFTVANAEDLAAATETATGSAATFTISSDVSSDAALTLTTSVTDFAECPTICSPNGTGVSSTLTLLGDWEPASSNASLTESAEGVSTLTYAPGRDAVVLERTLTAQSAAVALDLSSGFAVDIAIDVDTATAELAGDGFVELLTPANGTLDVQDNGDHVTYVAHLQHTDAVNFEQMLIAYIPDAEFTQWSSGGFLSSTSTATMWLPLGNLLGEHLGIETTGSVTVPFARSIDADLSAAEGVATYGGRELTFTSAEPGLISVSVTESGATLAGLVLLAAGAAILLGLVVLVVIFRKRLKELFFGRSA